MPTKINLELGKRLREEGLGYKEISVQLDCSVDWCKKNLSSVTKNKVQQERIMQLVAEARQGAGITKSELREFVLQTDRPDSSLSKTKFNQEVSTKVNTMVTKIKSHEGTLVRPAWMNPGNAVSCYYKLAELAMALDDKMQECIQDYFMDTGVEETEGTRYSFLMALLQVSKASKFMGINPATILGSYDSIAHELKERNGDSGLMWQES